MTLSKQQRQAIFLSVLLAVLAITLYWSFAGSATPSGLAPAANPNSQDQALDLKDLYLKRNPRRSNLKKDTSFRDIDPSLHLEKLNDFDPGSPLNARNMFSVEGSQARVMAKNSKPTTAVTSTNPSSGPQISPASRPVSTPTVLINLKFFGTKLDLRYKSRQGFFAEGDQVYLVSEGDLVANRYRILHIGENSAEIEELSSKTRRQISLQ